MDEAEAEMLLGLKPKPGTLVPVKSGKVGAPASLSLLDSIDCKAGCQAEQVFMLSARTVPGPLRKYCRILAGG